MLLVDVINPPEVNSISDPIVVTLLIAVRAIGVEAH